MLKSWTNALLHTLPFNTSHLWWNISFGVSCFNDRSPCVTPLSWYSAHSKTPIVNATRASTARSYPTSLWKAAQREQMMNMWHYSTCGSELRIQPKTRNQTFNQQWSSYPAWRKKNHCPQTRSLCMVKTMGHRYDNFKMLKRWPYWLEERFGWNSAWSANCRIKGSYVSACIRC